HGARERRNSDHRRRPGHKRATVPPLHAAGGMADRDSPAEGLNSSRPERPGAAFRACEEWPEPLARFDSLANHGRGNDSGGHRSEHEPPMTGDMPPGLM